jgi:hypothetical protein
MFIFQSILVHGDLVRCGRVLGGIIVRSFLLVRGGFISINIVRGGDIFVSGGICDISSFSGTSILSMP